jgi:two-component system OmpR family sensor kinase
MSSSPASRTSRNWSLRQRLLAGQLALLAVLCVGIGFVTEVALYRYLVGELDTQLRHITQRSSKLESQPPPPQPGSDGQPSATAGAGPLLLVAPGQPVGMVAAIVSNGATAQAGVLKPGGERGEVSAEAARQLSAAAGIRDPESKDLDGLGRYRLISTPGRQPANSLVIGLDMSAVEQTLTRVALIFAVVTVCALIVAALAGLFLIRKALTPLDRVAAAAGAVADLPLDRGEVTLPVRVDAVDTNPGTEVGRLGLAVNRMLDHVAGALSARQASESRVRQFVADASHELRTPLAAIRGYTELAQRRRAEVPADVAHAMGRVESEADRMTQLVEDLLLLARLDSGRQLDCQPVDLPRLCADAVSDAHIAGPDHHWTLDVPTDSVHVLGDGARLHQVVANLLANARDHTHPGTTVNVALSTEGDAAVIRVLDDGPGIPAMLQSEVFERFARADTGRSRQNGSTGLGLAIVSAVVRAHDGVIAVHSVPGRTEFTVRLPMSTQMA